MSKKPWFERRKTIYYSYILTNKGVGQTTISAGELAAGSYFYTLIADGAKTVTKQIFSK